MGGSFCTVLVESSFVEKGSEICVTEEYQRNTETIYVVTYTHLVQSDMPTRAACFVQQYSSS